jgi:hypothetical protein
MNASMSIDEQVEYLMRGTEYGDEELKQTMTQELRQRLIEAGQGRPLRIYCGYDRVLPTCTWAIRSPCASCANFRSWATR